MLTLGDSFLDLCSARKKIPWNMWGSALARHGGLLLLCAGTSYAITQGIYSADWPSYTSSHTLQALTHALVIIIIFCVATIAYLSYKARTTYIDHHKNSPSDIPRPALLRRIGVALTRQPRHGGHSHWYIRLLTAVQCWNMTVLTTLVLAVPLAGTHLYVGGISVDQQFRTEFLTRSTDTWSLHDMTYADLPSFYPSMWFWFGGRFAQLFHLSGWEAFKPYSIMTISLAVAIAFLWWKHLQPHLGIWFTLVTICAILPYSQEPYSVILAIIALPAMYSLWKGLLIVPISYHRIITTIVPVAIFIGIAQASYTLYAGLFWWILLLICALRWRKSPTRITLHNILLCLGIILIISTVIALGWWIPFLTRLWHDPGAIFQAGGATAFLPINGADLWFPFFQASVMGMVCLCGIIWLILSWNTRHIIAQICITMLVGLYSWQLLSLLFSLENTTLLGFRMEPLITLTYSCAGIMGIIQGMQTIITLAKRTYPRAQSYITSPSSRATTIGAVLIVICLAWSQFITHVMSRDIAQAYTDTDGYGNRADHQLSDSRYYFPLIHKYIQDTTRKPEHDIIVFTHEYGFLALYPYYGFQSLTPHYANPLAHYAQRNRLIQTWSRSTHAVEFENYLAHSTIPVPQVWIFRATPEGNYLWRMTENAFPNDPNVHYSYVLFPSHLFSSFLYARKNIGPFTILIRHSPVTHKTPAIIALSLMNNTLPTAH